MNASPQSRPVTLVRAFIVLLVLSAALEWAQVAAPLRLVLSLALLGTGAVLLVRFIRTTLRKSIWRLRNRLFVTYLFIAVVPIVLTLALAATGTWIVAGQIAVYLVSSELDRRTAALENPVRALSLAKPAERSAMAQQLAPLIEDRLPGFELAVIGEQNLHFPPESTLTPPPSWSGNYTGIVARDGRYYSISIFRSRGTIAMVLAPIDSRLLGKVAPGIGQLDLNQRDMAGTLPPPVNFLDFETPWLGRIPAASWDNFAKKQDGALVIRTRPSAVLSALFQNKVDDAQTALVIFAVIATLLLIVEALSLVIGASLTRTMTSAVHGLYEGTMRISNGDFAYRIPVKGKDQLAELGTSFNNMTTQLENLIVVAKEKERLQSEIEIASEVQNQLFPRSAPSLKKVEVVGICQPARMVSGDYYDYLCLPDGNLALALGDVAGKGISAALLMASIQSIMRTQLAAGLPLAVASGADHTAPRVCTAGVIAQLNRQLYASTAPEKYATLFFGVYDEQSRILTYTNAGHLPPLLVHKGEVKSLEVTGTVVGAFPSVAYDEQTVQLSAGDLLVAYTDGITEPENAYGEEFGEARLAEVVTRHQHADLKEIIAKIMEAVAQWSTAPELPDDMTVVIARGLA